MPLIRIDVIEGRPEADLAAIGAAVHRALVECFNVPERDQSQVITEAAHTRPQDVMITFVEHERQDWSFGNGVAQYLTLPREQWK